MSGSTTEISELLPGSPPVIFQFYAIHSHEATSYCVGILRSRKRCTYPIEGARLFEPKKKRNSKRQELLDNLHNVIVDRPWKRQKIGE